MLGHPRRGLDGSGSDGGGAVLVDDRSTGTEGDRAAVAWAIETMRAIGFDTVRTQSVAVPRWERGTLEARIVGEALPEEARR